MPYRSHLRIGLHGQEYDNRGVKEVEATRMLTPTAGVSPLHSSNRPWNRHVIAKLGKDKDGAFRVENRIDKKKVG